MAGKSGGGAQRSPTGSELDSNRSRIVTVTLDLEMHAALRAHAVRTGRTLGDVVRQAIETNAGALASQWSDSKAPNRSGSATVLRADHSP